MFIDFKNKKSMLKKKTKKIWKNYNKKKTITLNVTNITKNMLSLFNIWNNIKENCLKVEKSCGATQIICPLMYIVIKIYKKQ